MPRADPTVNKAKTKDRRDLYADSLKNETKAGKRTFPNQSLQAIAFTTKRISTYGIGYWFWFISLYAEILNFHQRVSPFKQDLT
ncbi:hypothetical protein X474_19910 [Dethiosulfatarculus sandiegensis]|uniref:Uncharacterized protein n=1 Tax=Dethiosulfatarculus sandiegensis TaxID=1429043 RepID=A0A0D2GBL1_9BACT|nr:hypothetical protein X474_19910 [Dethiosulfatarculus sandiegensis]